MDTVRFTTTLDRSENGAPKLTKDGMYRFSVGVRDKDDGLLIQVDGFRLDTDFNRVLPPASYGKFHMIHIVTIGMELEKRMIAAVKRQLGLEENGATVEAAPSESS